ncbi:unnamed protein product [Auanema sp. JU1783]|nr:unnamed protein product [Auanema sp. JU1783]
MTVSYSSGNFFRLFLRWKGSIWRSVWRELCVFLILFYSIRLFYNDVIPYLDPHSRKSYKKTFNRLAREFNEYTKLIPLTFLLGFYVSNVVSRWWRQFESLSWPEDLISIVCLVLPFQDTISSQARHQIARYANLAATIAWRDISSKVRLRFPELSNLIDAGLLTEHELQALQSYKEDSPGIMWLTPLHWVQQIIAREVSSNRAQVQYLSSFSNELKNYRVSLRRLYSHDWVCLPLVYTQVAALATYSFFFFCLFGRQFLDDDEGIDFRIPLFTIVQFLFFVGWFKVGQDLMRPFGLDDDDIELNYILDRNLVSSFAIIHTLHLASPPNFEEDSYWTYSQSGKKPENSSLLWGRIDLTRTAHKHPPKSHTYIDIDDDSMNFFKSKCYMSSRPDKFMYW